MKIIIADDHPLFLEGVKYVLQSGGNYEIAETASDGGSALRKILEYEPDIAVVDIRMPVKSGLEVLEYLSNINSPVKVILLTMYKNAGYLYKAISLGVKGYLSKEDANNEIIRAVETISTGGVYISTSLAGLLHAKEKNEIKIKENIAAIASLTKMEREVLKLIAEWKTNIEIAADLSISSRTVGNHRTNISGKLKLRGSHTLIKFAIENRDIF